MIQKITETSLEISAWFSWLNSNKINIDMWITDPPYPFSNQNGTGRFKYSGGTDNMYPRLEWGDLHNVFSSMFKSSNDGARAYIFCNRDGLFETKGLLEDAGWRFRNLLVWDKKRMGMGYHWRNRVEYIIYVTNGKPLTFVKGKSNILSYPKPYGGVASEKPYEIWSDILKNGAVDGDICADPFSGTNPMKKAILNSSSLSGKISKVYTNIF